MPWTCPSSCRAFSLHRFLKGCFPKTRRLIVVASTSVLTPQMLDATGLRADVGQRVVIAGGCPAFARTWIRSEGSLEVGACEKDVVDVTVAIVKDRPDIGMLLLE